MQVSAFTKVGAGVRSHKLICTTAQDGDLHIIIINIIIVIIIISRFINTNYSSISRDQSSQGDINTYLIFVIFLHEQNFWKIKFTPKKRVNYDKIHRKLPFFCVITAKYTVNCQFFALNL